MNNHLALPSIQRIPNELLERIFLFVHPKVLVRQSDSVPFNVAKVCRQWRQMALSSVKLWSCLHLDVITYDSITNQQRYLRVVETCLKRSRQCPLSISIVYETQQSPTSLRPPRKILQALIQHANRWQKLLINSNLLSDDLVGESGFPALQSLYLRGDQKITADLPRLSHLRLQCVYSPAQLRKIRWSSLTHLHLDDGCNNLSEVVKVLAALHDIKWIHLHHNGWETPVPQVDTHQEIKLPHLNRLLLCVPYEVIKIILGKITAPSLSVLHLFDTTAQPTWEYCNELHQLLERSQCHIHELVLWKFPTSIMSSLVQKLQHLNRLKIAFMEEQSGYQVILRLLRLSKKQSVPLPELKSFHLYHDRSYKKENYIELMETLQKRLSLNQKLREVKLMFGLGMTKSLAVEGEEVMGHYSGTMKVTSDLSKTFLDTSSVAAKLAPDICSEMSSGS
ncbi:hypothetical protein BDQ17DRAFT_1350478 [Cyathus striatus]|nr:hypothetical protein BDQ17DRAFT_1350478 [Cyathus striatus]